MHTYVKSNGENIAMNNGNENERKWDSDKKMLWAAVDKPIWVMQLLQHGHTSRAGVAVSSVGGGLWPELHSHSRLHGQIHYEGP